MHISYYFLHFSFSDVKLIPKQFKNLTKEFKTVLHFTGKKNNNFDLLIIF